MNPLLSLKLITLDVLNGNDGKLLTTEIRGRVSQRTNKEYSIGAIITVLDRLYNSGLVEFEMTKSRAQVGGRPRREYRITLKGKRQLDEAICSLNTFKNHDLSTA